MFFDTSEQLSNMTPTIFVVKGREINFLYKHISSRRPVFLSWRAILDPTYGVNGRDFNLGREPKKGRVETPDEA